MGERERLKETGTLAALQAALEWNGLEIDQAKSAADLCAKWVGVDPIVNQLFAKCESPAERRLLLACFHQDSGLGQYRVDEHWPEFVWFDLRETDESDYDPEAYPSVRVEPQSAVDLDETTIRCDFEFTLEPSRKARHLRQESVYVEVDGFDWHERTKEQASNDRARDREIMRAYGRVVRFTGSDVWSGAVRVVREITLLLDRFRDDAIHTDWYRKKNERQQADLCRRSAFRDGFYAGRRWQRTLARQGGE